MVENHCLALANFVDQVVVSTILGCSCQAGSDASQFGLLRYFCCYWNFQLLQLYAMAGTSNPDCSPRNHTMAGLPRTNFASTFALTTIISTLLCLLILGGCRIRQQPSFSQPCVDCKTSFTQIEYPDIADSAVDDASEFQTQAPPTIANFYEQEAMPLTLEEAVELALLNSNVLQKLGGRVLASPQGTPTVYDPAILETNPFQGAEAALSAFDAQFTGSANFVHSERLFNNLFFGAGANSLVSNNGDYRAELSKTTASGSTFAVRNLTNYAFSNNAGNLFPSAYDTLLQAEWRQPLARGFGTAVNRIAGPNATSGNYNGVLIGRIRGDIALTDFEAAVRDLVRDVESAYWELYFAYRDLDVRIRAREDSRLIWDNRKKRVDAGLSRPDDEAQTRQQYYTFDQQVINALSGNASGQTGVLGAERQLRRLMGLLNNDGRMIRPTTEPTIAPIIFDWDLSQLQALTNRVELRRQKWSVRQRELELYAARKLNKWRFDFVGSVSARGFGDDLFGNRDQPSGSAVDNLFEGDLDDWALGFELAGPVGNRQGHLAIRHAELQLIREKTLLREQQKQLLMDLNAAYTEVDRAYATIKTAYNTRLAVLAELDPKRRRADAGDEDIFFLLDAQQRASQTETNFHRAVVDYNLALQNYVYTTGGMLEHYNIQLAEGKWNAAAQADAASKDHRYRTKNFRARRMAVSPLSDGPVDQTTDTLVLSSGNESPSSDTSYYQDDSENLDTDADSQPADGDRNGDNEDILDQDLDSDLDLPDASSRSPSDLGPDGI